MPDGASVRLCLQVHVASSVCWSVHPPDGATVRIFHEHGIVVGLFTHGFALEFGRPDREGFPKGIVVDTRATGRPARAS